MKTYEIHYCLVKGVLTTLGKFNKKTNRNFNNKEIHFKIKTCVKFDGDNYIETRPYSLKASKEQIVSYKSVEKLFFMTKTSVL